MNNQKPMQAVVVPGTKRDPNQASMVLALYDEAGEEIVLGAEGGGGAPAGEPVLREVGGAGETVTFTDGYGGAGVGVFFYSEGSRTYLEGRAGKAAAASAGEVLFELPEENRPERNVWFKVPIQDNDTSAQLPDVTLFIIAVTGQVMLSGPVDGVTNIQVSLDGVNFRNAPAA